MTNSNFRPTRVGGPLPPTVEAPSVGQGSTATRGHLADHGGLRGHSVDPDTYPWRVVGVGQAWEVHGVDGFKYAQGLDVYDAHAAAREAKLLHPAGYIEDGPLGPRNISGPYDTIPGRLAWLRFNVVTPTGRIKTYTAHARQTAPGAVLVTPHGHTMAAPVLGVRYLADTQAIRVVLDRSQFSHSHKLEVEP